MTFKDHFSKQAADYANFRPRYPRELFEYLGSVAPSRALAWDCATGNGQAAVELAEVFDRVIATDASEKQIANAEPQDRVEYRIASAEESGLESDTIDLIMVAQALHWFDLPRFYEEVPRVLKSKGVFAASAYKFFHITPEIDPLVNHRYYDKVVGPFWPPERTLVEKFEELPLAFFGNSDAFIRNDRAMEPGTPAGLSEVVVRDATLHRGQESRSVGDNRRRATRRVGRR